MRPALALRLAQTLGLVLDVNRDLGKRLRVFPTVVCAEEQLTRVRKQDADVRLGAASIAQVQCGQRLSGGYSSGHVAFSWSHASGCSVRLAPVALTGQHNAYPGVRLPVTGGCTPQAKTALASVVNTPDLGLPAPGHARSAVTTPPFG